MTLLSLPYVNRFYDRHGRLRFYFRRRGTRRPLPGIPGSSEFMAAYQAALDETKETKVAPIDKASTIAQLAASWRASASFTNLSASTQAVYRRILDGLTEAHGDKPARLIERRHVARMIDQKAKTPSAANRLLSVLHLMMIHAIREQVRDDIPLRTFNVSDTTRRASLPGPKPT